MDTLFDIMRAGFLDELEKIAASAKLTGLKHRIGKRSLRVDTLLKKEKDGTLYKFTRGKKTEKTADSVGTSVPFSNSDAQGSTGKPAQAPKVQGEVPSREDGRENQQVRIPGTGRYLLAPAAAQDPAEHGNY